MALTPLLKRALLCLSLVFTASLPAQAGGRGPSTPEERAKVLKLTKASELDLMAGTSEEDRFWFLKLVSDVPDISLTVGPVAVWCSDAMKEEQRPLTLFHFMMSAVSFQIENPAKAKDEEAVDLAGLEGVLRAYENLVKKSPGARSAKMDDAITLRGKAGLAGFVKDLRAKK